MKYPLLPSGDVLAAWETMPRTPDGYVIALQFIPARYLAPYETQWREWAKVHARSLWPDWLIRWAESKP